MNKNMVMYPAKFERIKENGDEYVVVEFIDLEGCITEGKDMKEAYLMAQDAMGLYLDEMIEYPVMTIDVDKIKLKKNESIMFVTLDIDEYKRKYNNKLVKKTLTIPCWLNTMAEENHINFSQELQIALKEKLKIGV